MANMWKIIALFLVFQEPAFVSSHLVLNKVLGLTVSAMECLSEKDITFFYTSTDTNIKVTVAECDRSIKSCYLLDQSIGELYSVSFIGGGGQFLILEDNSNTWGQYICCETHNSTSCQSTEISPTIISSTDANTDRNSNSHLGEKQSTVINSTVIKETTVINQTVIKETSNNVDVTIPLVAALVPLAIVAIVVFGLVFYFKDRPSRDCGNCRSNRTPGASNEEVTQKMKCSNKDNEGEGKPMIEQPTVVHMPPPATSTSVQEEDEKAQSKAEAQLAHIGRKYNIKAAKDVEESQPLDDATEDRPGDATEDGSDVDAVDKDEDVMSELTESEDDAEKEFLSVRANRQAGNKKTQIFQVDAEGTHFVDIHPPCAETR